MKDRARPFSKKHRKYWIPVTGGMILIGIMNVAIGFCTYDKPTDTHERIQVHIPPAAYKMRPVVLHGLPDAMPADGPPATAN